MGKQPAVFKQTGELRINVSLCVLLISLILFVLSKLLDKNS
jgi:hypothetical protein